jgi:pilus assembly protein TadC
MTSVLLVLLSVAALGSSLALLFASLGLPWAADALAVAAALGGLGGFVLTAAFTIRRARRLGGARP